jgi:hypothetical protein
MLFWRINEEIGFSGVYGMHGREGIKEVFL